MELTQLARLHSTMQIIGGVNFTLPTAVAGDHILLGGWGRVDMLLIVAALGKWKDAHGCSMVLGLLQPGRQDKRDNEERRNHPSKSRPRGEEKRRPSSLQGRSINIRLKPTGKEGIGQGSR